MAPALSPPPTSPPRVPPISVPPLDDLPESMSPYKSHFGTMLALVETRKAHIRALEPVRMRKLAARVTELAGWLAANAPEECARRWAHGVMHPQLLPALLAPPGVHWCPVVDLDELHGLQLYAARCAQAPVVVVRAERRFDLESEQRFEDTLRDGPKGHVRSATDLLHMDGSPRELLLWRGYAPSEDAAGCYDWAPEPATRRPPPRPPLYEAVFATRTLRRGTRPCEVREGSSQALLVRVNVGDCAVPPTLLKDHHDSYFSDTDFAVFDRRAVLPHYRVTLDGL